MLVFDGFCHESGKSSEIYRPPVDGGPVVLAEEQPRCESVSACRVLIEADGRSESSTACDQVPIKPSGGNELRTVTALHHVIRRCLDECLPGDIDSRPFNLQPGDCPFHCCKCVTVVVRVHDEALDVKGAPAFEIALLPVDLNDSLPHPGKRKVHVDFVRVMFAKALAVRGRESENHRPIPKIKVFVHHPGVGRFVQPGCGEQSVDPRCDCLNVVTPVGIHALEAGERQGILSVDGLYIFFQPGEISSVFHPRAFQRSPVGVVVGNICPVLLFQIELHSNSARRRADWPSLSIPRLQAVVDSSKILRQRIVKLGAKREHDKGWMVVEMIEVFFARSAHSRHVPLRVVAFRLEPDAPGRESDVRKNSKLVACLVVASPFVILAILEVAVYPGRPQPFQVSVIGPLFIDVQVFPGRQPDTFQVAVFIDIHVAVAEEFDPSAVQEKVASSGREISKPESFLAERELVSVGEMKLIEMRILWRPIEGGSHGECPRETVLSSCQHDVLRKLLCLSLFAPRTDPGNEFSCVGRSVVLNRDV